MTTPKEQAIIGQIMMDFMRLAHTRQIDQETIHKREFRITYLCGKCDLNHHLRGTLEQCLGLVTAMTQMNFPRITIADEAYAQQMDLSLAEEAVAEGSGPESVKDDLSALLGNVAAHEPERKVANARTEPNAPWAPKPGKVAPPLAVGLDVGRPGGDRTMMTVIWGGEVIGFAPDADGCAVILRDFLNKEYPPRWQFWKRRKRG